MKDWIGQIKGGSGKRRPRTLRRKEKGDGRKKSHYEERVGEEKRKKGQKKTGSRTECQMNSLERGQEGITLLEKRLQFLERTENGSSGGRS